MTWTKDKPVFTEECVFVTANKYVRNDAPLQYDYSVWEIKILEGENEKGEPANYLGLLNGDGEEWGDLADLTADLYCILPKHEAKL